VFVWLQVTVCWPSPCWTITCEFDCCTVTDPLALVLTLWFDCVQVCR
jgi:hypothetical protein